MAPEHHERLSIARRSVLRTAAHVAWAVPAISVVAAAPAFADSHETVPVGAFSMTPDLAAVQVTNVSLTYSPEPWAGGDLYLTFSAGGMMLDAYAEGSWTVDGPGASPTPRFRYTGSITSGITLQGRVLVYEWDELIPPGTAITASLENASGTVAYFQDSEPWPNYF